MMTIAEAHKALDRWYADGCVGNLYFFRQIGEHKVCSFVEQTIKLTEMTDDQKAAVLGTFLAIDFQKAELLRNRAGSPDRIKIVRSHADR